MSVWGLLGSPESRAPWETFLQSKGMHFVAVDRAPLPELKKLTIVLIVDNDFRSKYTKKIALFEDHLNPAVPIVNNLIAASSARLTKYVKDPTRIVGMAICPPFGRYGIEFTHTELSNPAMVESALIQLTKLELSIEKISDRCGGIFPRIIARLVNEATFAVQEGLGAKEDIDEAMVNGANFPERILNWGDEIGTQFILDVLEGLRTETRDSRYRASAYLIRHAALKVSLLK